MTVYFPEYETGFKQADKALQGGERTFRLLQGLAQFASAMGWNGKVMTHLGFTADFARIADRCLDVRMVILATEIFKDIGRFNYKHSFADVRAGNNPFSIETSCSIACLTLNSALFSSCFTTQIPLIPKGQVTELLSVALKPALVGVLTMMWVRKYYDARGESAQKEDHQRESNKFALDLAATLIPILLPQLLGGEKWQNPIFHTATGAFGLWVICKNFPTGK